MLWQKVINYGVVAFFDNLKCLHFITELNYSMFSNLKSKIQQSKNLFLGHGMFPSACFMGRLILML